MSRKQKKNLIRIIVSAVLLVLFSLLKIENVYLRLAAFLVPYFIIGYDVLKKAFKGIINRQVFDENFLMAVATLGAIAIGIYKNVSFAEAVAVMLFYQIGELFQSYAVGKSRRNIAELMDIRPESANLFVDGKTVTVSPEEVETGSIILVSTGEKIPIDGVVAEGSATLDTSALTGESVPREATVGSEVISGCINMSGMLKIRTTKPFGESAVSKILDLVENAGAKKAKTE
ncbi:MAG: heavy metal translocating P-type ATPase, partial [Eubacterium sp.]|nr:heavy metal translocating P-type ATPase [Eubacterium sp.]